LDYSLWATLPADYTSTLAFLFVRQHAILALWASFRLDSLHAILLMRTANNHWQTHWLSLAQNWQHLLADAGLGEIAHSVGYALRPLAPLAAQILWVVQPGFAILGHSEAVGALAALLDEPEAPDPAAQAGTDE
jgi:hypothetical protein